MKERSICREKLEEKRAIEFPVKFQSVQSLTESMPSIKLIKNIKQVFDLISYGM